MPTGDICLVRQVFQHLPNAQIKAALDKMMRNFANIIVTEHFPAPADFKRANIDTVAAASTRVPFGSAVALDQPPFSIHWEEILNCPAANSEAERIDIYSRGSIRTFLMRTCSRST